MPDANRTLAGGTGSAADLRMKRVRGSSPVATGNGRVNDDPGAYLAARDRRLASLVGRVGPYRLIVRRSGTHFGALVRSIIYQQLSGKAAATIHRRFEGIYGGRTPSPEQLLATSNAVIRAAGLSSQKLGYLRDLALRVHTADVPLHGVSRMSDDEVIAHLVKVKGIGRWTSQMFLMFRLGRPNVLPELDLGVQKGIQLVYGLPTLPKPVDVLRIGERWAPYRSAASWYLWRSLEL